MPARIVIVHDDPVFLQRLDACIREAGYDVASFNDSIAAWDALNAANAVEVLVTRIQFAGAKPHGIALARTARMLRPKCQVVFVARPEMRPHAEGHGSFIPTPAEPADVVIEIERLLAAPLVPRAA